MHGLSHVVYDLSRLFHAEPDLPGQALAYPPGAFHGDTRLPLGDYGLFQDESLPLFRRRGSGLLGDLRLERGEYQQLHQPDRGLYGSLHGPSSEGGEELAPPFLFRGHADLLYGLLHGKVRQRGPFLRGAFCPPPPLRLEVEGELPPLLGVDPRFPLLYVDAGLSHKERDDPSYRKYL